MNKLIIFIGAPGSGKSSRAKECGEKLGLTHMSTGDTLQKLGYNVADPKSIPDSVTIGLIKEAMEKSKVGRVIVDGFPRILKQANALDQEVKVDQIVYLKISKSEARKRVLDRIVCPKCNRSYTENGTYKKPKIHGMCDECNEPLIKRKSDTLDIFNKRFSNFCRYTYAVLEHYDKKGVKITRVDATEEVDITKLI